MNLKKYIKYLIISIGLFLITTLSASDVPQTIEFEGSNLILNGQGTRVVFFITLILFKFPHWQMHWLMKEGQAPLLLVSM